MGKDKKEGRGGPPRGGQGQGRGGGPPRGCQGGKQPKMDFKGKPMGYFQNRGESNSYISEDGINWTDITMPSINSPNVCYGNEKFVMINAGSDIGYYSTETNETIQSTLNKKDDSSHTHEI